MGSMPAQRAAAAGPTMVQALAISKATGAPNKVFDSQIPCSEPC